MPERYEPQQPAWLHSIRAACVPLYNEIMARFFIALYLLVLAAGSVAGEAGSDYARANQKIGLLEGDRIPPGTHIDLSLSELNAYVRVKARATVPEGLRDPKLDLGHGSATGTALIDFMKLPEARKLPVGTLLRMLIGGERPVRVTARIRSGSGKAVVDVESVQISGLTVEGAALDFLIQRFLLPRYPDAKIGQPFELSHGVERLEVRPEGIKVVLKN